jgi:hypothetical protein
MKKLVQAMKRLRNILAQSQKTAYFVDLDETLLHQHTDESKGQRPLEDIFYDILGQNPTAEEKQKFLSQAIVIEKNSYPLYVFVRPDAHEFLAALKAKGPVAIYTAGMTKHQTMIARLCGFDVPLFGRDSTPVIPPGHDYILIDDLDFQSNGVQTKLAHLRKAAKEEHLVDEAKKHYIQCDSYHQPTKPVKPLMSLLSGL